MLSYLKQGHFLIIIRYQNTEPLDILTVHTLDGVEEEQICFRIL